MLEVETESTYLKYFFKKTILGMVLSVRITNKYYPRNSYVKKCTEEEAQGFINKVLTTTKPVHLTDRK